jgi:hypothetical protein
MLLALVLEHRKLFKTFHQFCRLIKQYFFPHNHSLVFYLFKASRGRNEVSALQMALKQLMNNLSDISAFAGKLIL